MLSGRDSSAYTKIVRNVQMLGQLRTIGMTKRQIKCMARREGLRYAFAGIPLGLAAGLLIGFAAYPDGFRIKTAAIYTALIAIAGVVMVNIAIFKPVRVAMNTSPIEGARYLACYRLDAMNHCITLKLPWPFLAELIAAMTVIYLIFTAYAGAELKKTGILSAIRKE